MIFIINDCLTELKNSLYHGQPYNFIGHSFFFKTHFFTFHADKMLLAIYYKESRKILNPKRLAEGWIYLQILLLELDTYGTLSNIKGIDVSEINDYLSNIRHTLLPYFIEKWSGIANKNDCINKKCWVALNIDGLHKINLLKCIYKKDYNIPEIGILFIIIYLN